MVLFNGLVSVSNKDTTAQQDDKYKTLPFGAIKPTGWIANQIERDLDKGITGHFDNFGKTVNYDLFVNQERISGRKT